MSYEIDRYTTGLSAKVLEPLDVLIGTVDFVKVQLGIRDGDTYYDKHIEGIIRAVNQRYEIETGILLKRRKCVVGWKKFYDFEQLPFGPSDIIGDSTQFALLPNGDFKDSSEWSVDVAGWQLGGGQALSNVDVPGVAKISQNFYAIANKQYSIRITSEIKDAYYIIQTTGGSVNLYQFVYEGGTSIFNFTAGGSTGNVIISILGTPGMVGGSVSISRIEIAENKGYDFVPVDVNGVVIESVEFKNNGYFEVLHGDFEDGISFEYKAGLNYVQSVNAFENNTFLQYEEHGQRMLDAILSIFNKELSLNEAVAKYFIP